VKAHKTSGGRKMPVRHTIPLGIVIFLVCYTLKYRNRPEYNYYHYLTCQYNYDFDVLLEH